jgi:hypothetical protein
VSWIALLFHLGEINLILGLEMDFSKVHCSISLEQASIQQELTENSVLEDTDPSPYRIPHEVDVCRAEESMKCY